MKYSIYGYNQETLIKHKLNHDDALILRVISDLFLSTSKKIISEIYDNDRYIWITYNFILKEIPIIGSDRTFVNKIKKLIDKKFLKKFVTHNREGQAGTFMYIAFGENYKNFLECSFSEQQQNLHGGYEENITDPMQKLHTKHLTTIYPSTIHNKKESTGIFVEEILRKYKECSLPEYKYPPSNYKIMECYNALGGDLFKAFEIMGKTEYVKSRFSINMVFNIENLKKALNGTFKDKVITKQENKISSHLLLHDKEYADNEDYENLLKALGLSD